MNNMITIMEEETFSLKAEIAKLKQESTSRDKIIRKLLGKASFVNLFKSCWFTNDRVDLIDQETEKTNEKIDKLRSKISELDIQTSELLAGEKSYGEVREVYVSKYFKEIELKQAKAKRNRLISLREMIIINSWSMACMLK